MIKLLIIAQLAIISWNEPSNISEIPVGFYLGYHGSAINGPFTNIFQTTMTNHSLGPLKSGRHFFYITAVGTNGFESDPSNKPFVPVINPPTNATVNIVVP